MSSQRAKRSMAVVVTCVTLIGGLAWWRLRDRLALRVDDPDCPDARVVLAEEGSELPHRLDRCHYERAISESSVTLHGPPHATDGVVAIWRELGFGEPSDSLRVGVMIAPLPNLLTDHMEGARVRLVVESVSNRDGRELIDHEGLFMDEMWEDLDPRGPFGTPDSSFSVESVAGPFASDEGFAASRTISLLEALNEADVAHVRGVVILRLPVGARTHAVPIGGAPVEAGDLRVSAVRAEDTAFEVRWTSSDSELLGLEAVPLEGSLFVRTRSLSWSEGEGGPGSGELEADYGLDVDTVRVSFAREFFEHRVPFDIRP